jgi:hypothetical protein
MLLVDSRPPTFAATESTVCHAKSRALRRMKSTKARTGVADDVGADRWPKGRMITYAVRIGGTQARVRK